MPSPNRLFRTDAEASSVLLNGLSPLVNAPTGPVLVDRESLMPDAHRSVLSVSLTNAPSLFRLSGEPAARRIPTALLFVMCKNSDATRTF